MIGVGYVFMLSLVFSLSLLVSGLLKKTKLVLTFLFLVMATMLWIWSGSLVSAITRPEGAKINNIPPGYKIIQRKPHSGLGINFNAEEYALKKEAEGSK